MLEQEKTFSNEFEKLAEKYPIEIVEGLNQLKQVSIENYKKTGNIEPLRGFFSVQNGKFVVYQTQNMDFVPDHIKNDKEKITRLLKNFKDFLDDRMGQKVEGLIMISEAWMKVAPKEANSVDFKLDKLPSEYEDKLDCMIFSLDSKSYSYTSIYEKITAEDIFVISPEPINEFFIDKTNPEEKKQLVFNNFNFFD